MKSGLVLMALVVAGIAGAQEYRFPYESEADRAPKIKTTGNCLIHAGRVITVSGETLKDAEIQVADGKIVYLGAPRPFIKYAGPVIDASDQVVMPGIVDAHIHRGIDATNEGADAITIEVRIADMLDPDDVTWWQALASGETSGMALHGSANPIGGQSQVIKFKYKHSVKESMVADAPRMVKFALGENVTRASSSQPSTRFPATRMGQEAVYRRAFEAAKTYMAGWDRWNRSDRKTPPPRKDLRLEALSDILRRKIWVMCHSYRADEILMMARLSKEYGFKIGAMQHALEAYKVAPELAEMGVPVSMFQDNWSFKLEGYDAIPAGPAICYKAGVLTSINTDGTSGTTALIYDAARLVREGLTENEALRTVTLNPAKQMGIGHRVGSIEVGKDADLVFYSGHPFNANSKVNLTMIEGEVLFTRRDKFNIDGVVKPKLDYEAPDQAPFEPKAEGSKIALVGGTIFPVDRPMIESGTVLISDGKIESVMPGSTVPRGYERVNIKGKRVYPGFFDCSSLLGLSEISPVSVSLDVTDNGDFQPDLKAATAVQSESAHFGPAMCNGILTAVVRPAGGLVPGRAGIVNTWGWNTQLRTISSDFAMVVNVPSAGGFRGGPRKQACACMGLSIEDILDGVTEHDHEAEEAEFQKALQGPMAAPQNQETPNRRQQGEAPPNITGRMKQLEDYFQSVRDYIENRKKDPIKTPLSLQMEAMIPVVEGKTPILMRVRTSKSILTAIDFCKRNKLKGILSGAAEGWKVLPEIKKSGMPVLITPAGESPLDANSPVNSYDPYDSPYIMPTMLGRAGIKFAFQSEDNAMTMDMVVRAGMAQGYGLSNETAIRALTLNAAEILGLQDHLGSLTEGKDATLIVTNGDPLECKTSVQMVMLKGKQVEMVSKHTMLRDKYAARLK